jgi:hypothetical protein
MFPSLYHPPPPTPFPSGFEVAFVAAAVRNMASALRAIQGLILRAAADPPAHALTRRAETCPEAPVSSEQGRFQRGARYSSTALEPRVIPKNCKTADSTDGPSSQGHQLACEDGRKKKKKEVWPLGKRLDSSICCVVSTT